MGCELMNFKNMNKIMKIVKLAFAILGIVFLIINFTIGEANESLLSTMTILARIYVYFVIFIVMCDGLLKYMYRHKDK